MFYVINVKELNQDLTSANSRTAETPALALVVYVVDVLGYLDGKVRNRPTRRNEIGSKKRVSLLDASRQLSCSYHISRISLQ